MTKSLYFRNAYILEDEVPENQAYVMVTSADGKVAFIEGTHLGIVRELNDTGILSLDYVKEGIKATCFRPAIWSVAERTAGD